MCNDLSLSLSFTHSHLLLFSIHLYNLVLSNNICLMMRPAFFRASSDRQTRKHALRSTINIIAIIAIYIRFLLKIASLWVRQWSMWLWPATNRMQRERCSSPVMANNGIFGHWDSEKKWEWPFSFFPAFNLFRGNSVDLLMLTVHQCWTYILAGYIRWHGHSNEIIQHSIIHPTNSVLCLETTNNIK